MIEHEPAGRDAGLAAFGPERHPVGGRAGTNEQTEGGHGDRRGAGDAADQWLFVDLEARRPLSG